MATTPTNHWKLGLFVVVGVLLALTVVVYLGAESLRKEHVTYQTFLDESVQGLDTGSPIFFRGVKVGQVSSIGVAPDDRHVAVSLALYTKNLHDLGLGHGDGSETRISVPPELRAQLINVGITGLKAVQIDFFDVRTNPAPELPFATPDRYIPAAVSTIKSIADSVVRASDRFPEVADALVKVAGHADRILDELESAHLPQGAALTMANLNKTMTSVQGAISDADVGGVSKQTKADLAHLDAAITRFDKILERVDGDKGLLASAQKATDAVGDAAAGAPEIGEEMVVTLRDIQEAAQSFRRLTDAIERDPDMLLKGRGRGE
jgi:paraquat-inducible protein B